MAITQKQKRFAELVAVGETYTNAYASVYDVSKSNPRTIAVEGSRLAHNKDVAEYVHKLNEQAAQSAIITRVGLLERVWRVNTIAYGQLTADTDNVPPGAFQAFLRTVELLVRLDAVPSVDEMENEHDAKERRDRDRMWSAMFELLPYLDED